MISGISTMIATFTVLALTVDAQHMFPRLKKSDPHNINTRTGVLELPNLLQREAMLIPDYLRILAEIRNMQTLATDQSFFSLPRMGRAMRYHYPRMGRSGVNNLGSDGLEEVVEHTCCHVGLKSEWGFGDGEFKVDMCHMKKCCQGLREFINIKPDSTFYSLCIPDVTVCKSLDDLKQ